MLEAMFGFPSFRPGQERLIDAVLGGTWGKPAGTFINDTSMTLATCDSIRAYGGRIDALRGKSVIEETLFE